MSDQSENHRDAQRVTAEHEKTRRAEVQRVADRNEKAHKAAKVKREAADKLRRANRGPDTR